MNLTEQQMPYRRGRILALLRASNDAGMAAPLLRSTLKGFGYKADEDTVRIDLSWLSRHGLLRSRDVAGVEMLAITPRGRDVITGDLDFPGVQLIED
jgi:repressor of nif and glnA expression